MMLCSSSSTFHLLSSKTWLNSAINQICRLKFALYAIAPLLGVKSGRNAGMMLNIVRIVVAVVSSLSIANRKRKYSQTQRPKNIN